jgi:hypothetical protein
MPAADAAIHGTQVVNAAVGMTHAARGSPNMKRRQRPPLFNADLTAMSRASGVNGFGRNGVDGSKTP